MADLLEQHGLEYAAALASNCMLATRSKTLVVVKHIRESTEEFERECTFARLAYDQHIGVQVLDCCRDPKQGGLLVLELWDMTLDAFLTSQLHKEQGNLATLRRHLRHIRRTLRSMDVIHADLIPRNIVCNIKRQQLQAVRLIDFGLSFFAGEVNREGRWPDLQVLHEHIYVRVQWPHLAGLPADTLPTVEEIYKAPELLDQPLFNYIDSLS